MTCAFCNRTDVHRCAWPAKKYRRTPMGEIVVGDKVHRDGESTRGLGRPPAVVTGIDAHLSRGGMIALVLTLPGDREIRTSNWSGSYLLALRDATCMAYCCEFHRVERGDRAIYCLDHMHAWEQVA